MNLKKLYSKANKYIRECNNNNILYKSKIFDLTKIILEKEEEIANLKKEIVKLKVKKTINNFFDSE